MIRQNLEGRDSEENYYRRILFCSVCGHRLHLVRDSVASRDKCALYQCHGYATSRNPTPHHISINKKLLDVIVLDQLQNQFHLARQFTSWLKSPEGKRSVSGCLDRLEKALEETKQEQDSLSRQRARIFEAFAESLLDQDSYLQGLEQIREKSLAASLAIENTAKERDSLRKAASLSNPWLVLFTAASAPVRLDETVTHSLIDRIDLAKSWQVTIHFKEENWFLRLQNFYETAHPQAGS